MGISHKDGLIHFAYDHHGSTLHYRKSIAGLASQPDKHEWCASNFGPTTSELESGKPLTGLTYPMFFSRPDGVLQLAYRLGSSGRGDWYLAEFSPDKRAWDTIGKLFSRNGKYHNSTSRCAYPNPFRYDSKNRLHVTWCWRERPVGVPFNLTTNHDICYAYSDDFGRTWHNNAGDRIADISANPIGIDTPGIVVAPTRFLHGQMNQVSQFVDNENRVHAMSWHRSGKESKASTDVNTWNYFHVWKGKGSEWHMDELPFKGRKPQIITDASGIAYVIYTKGENSEYHGTETGGKLTISASTEESKWMAWTTVWQPNWTGIGEPLLDIGRWQSDGVLSIYLQQKPDKNGDPCKLHIVDLLRK